MIFESKKKPKTKALYFGNLNSLNEVQWQKSGKYLTWEKIFFIATAIQNPEQTNLQSIWVWFSLCSRRKTNRYLKTWITHSCTERCTLRVADTFQIHFIYITHLRVTICLTSTWRMHWGFFKPDCWSAGQLCGFDDFASSIDHTIRAVHFLWPAQMSMTPGNLMKPPPKFPQDFNHVEGTCLPNRTVIFISFFFPPTCKSRI